jgi:hypothetical protein
MLIVNVLGNCKCNAQHTWQEIKNVFYEGRNISNITEINYNGSLSKKPYKITNTFNEYFANVGPNLAKKKVAGNSAMYINQVVDHICSCHLLMRLKSFIS